MNLFQKTELKEFGNSFYLNGLDEAGCIAVIRAASGVGPNSDSALGWGRNRSSALHRYSKSEGRIFRRVPFSSIQMSSVRRTVRRARKGSADSAVVRKRSL